MTTPNTPSGRCSARVVTPGPAPTVIRAVGHESAPGSLTDQVRPASPERVGRPAPQTHQHNRVSGGTQRAQAERLRDQLSDRDQAVLLTLDAHRFLSTHQLQRFHFHEHTTHGAASRICRRVLHRLHELGVIDHLDRRVGGVRAGSASYVWRVGPIGHQLLHLNTTPDRPRPRRKEPSLRWLQHCLAVADTHLTLRDLARADHLELLQVQTEPSCWRHYLGSGGNRETLKPDLYAVTATGDYEDHWFCELDRATESLPTLLGKCAQYQDYRRSGSEQQGGGVFPLVVWVVPDDIRAAKLTSAIRSSRSLDAGLYRICTPDSFPAVITGGPA